MKKILASGAALLLALQLLRPAQTTAPTGPGDLLALHPAPEPVRRLLQAACYDCHSNQTRYPWYAKIEPIGWGLASHVRDGRAALNFSTFGTLSAKDAAHLLDACVDQVNHGEMPLTSYRLLHADARLDESDQTLLTAWFQGVGDKIATARGK